MYKTRPELNAQDREKLRVERLKARNEDRAKRLLNAKLRIYGRDNEALREQMYEKAQQKRMERDRDLALDAKRVEEAKTLAVLEKEQKDQRKMDAYQLAAFHREQKKLKEMRDAEERDFIRGDGGPAVRNQDTLFLQFHGEDMGKNDRVKMQREQQKQWIIQQMMEKEQARKNETEMDKRYETFTGAVGGICEEAERDKSHDKVQRAIECQEYNRKLALAKKAKMRQRKYEDEKLAEAQKESISNSKLLKEDLSDTYMTGNPNRRVPYNFKGFSPEEKQRILDQQMRQIKEKEERANKQLEEKFEYDRQQEMYRRQLVLLEREKIAEQQKEAQRLAAFHQSQKLERNIQKRNLTQEVYQNAVSPDFYNRFAEINVQNQRP
mmetsp:Transcript_18986/g.30180  ORF Transcript_18986/g.30180 Transcript_18986/m.30180 type:complete len:380 (-) Transcript_18986:169-1308(-)|eukprot:jgi/Bigna1/88477/estExt_fgenesh1_pg.C_320123